MDLTTFLQFFINGIVLGAIYVLLAIGLSIIFGMIGIVNLTHGILYMLGAYATVTLAPYIGFFPNLIISPLLVALLGMAVEAAFLRQIYKGDPALGNRIYIDGRLDLLPPRHRSRTGRSTQLSAGVARTGKGRFESRWIGT